MPVINVPNETESLEAAPKKWARAEELAREASVSRPMIYKLVRRFRTPSVSLAEGGRCGARLFRRDLFLESIDKLAAEQVGKPFPPPRGRQNLGKQQRSARLPQKTAA